MKENIVGIIGAGPAGIAAAIQLKRNNINPLFFEKKTIGGLLINANLVENYPGFPDGITGIELISKFKHHIKNLNINLQQEEVLNINYSKNLFIIKTNKNIYTTKYLIVATGTCPEKVIPEIYGLNPTTSFFYEASSLFHCNNKKIAIIGGGDATFDYAISLSKTNQIYIFNKNEKPKCIPILFKRCSQKSTIKIFNNHEIKKIYLNNNKKNIEFINDSNFIVDEIIFATGRISNKNFLDKNLNIKYLEKENKFFFAGDIKNKNFRQVGICVGDGLKAAMKITEQ